ncbi:MAG: phage terminase small subunit P27 family [Planctomycetes bacterium]|nr:phage terminase small subunit P27 family [Planctomycetota bacterium]
MPKPGPRPTPTRVLRLRGSWRAKRNSNEPQPKVVKPAAPAWLSDDAKKVFDEYAETLHASGVLTAVDQFALARYADLWSQYRRCAEFTAKHGEVWVVRGRPGPNGAEGRPVGFATYPQAKLKLALAAALLQLEREFGLTPAARAGLRTDEVCADETRPADYYFGTGWREV